jgi:drug/metabolite transporter (DMT)-like permease
VTKEGKRSFAAEGFLLLTTLIWGTTFSLTKSLFEGSMHPFGLVAYRFGIASVFFAVLFGRRLRAEFDRRTWLRGMLLGTNLYAGYALQTMGLELTTSSRSGFITVLYVIITPLLQLMVTRRLPRLNIMIGALMAVVGVWGLTSPGGTLDGLIDPWRTGGVNLGDILTLVSSIIFAVYIILLDRLAEGTRPLSLTGAQIGTVAVLAITHAAIVEPPSAPASGLAWGKLFFLAIVATVTTTYWQTRYQPAVAPARAAVIFTLESVFGAFFAYLILGEHLGPVALAGAVLIIAGLLVTELVGRRNVERRT